MNKRMKQMMGKTVIGTTLAAMAALGAGQVASASGTTGTCVTTGIFVEDGTCTVLPGEAIEFTVQGGAGGPGGNGGSGGDGLFRGAYEGGYAGFGGRGGIGGSLGRGAEVVGSYTNSTDETVTLTVFVGVAGLSGSDGMFGVSGVEGTPSGANGTDGGDGVAGTESSIFIDDLLVVSAQGGTGGKGGKGGQGGTSPTGVLGSPNGVDGEPGEDGLDGVNGSYAPSPLPEGWIYTEEGLSTASVTFVSGVPATTTAPPQLPATGGDAGPTVWVTLLVLASGASLVVLSRRRVVS